MVATTSALAEYNKLVSELIDDRQQRRIPTESITHHDMDARRQTRVRAWRINRFAIGPRRELYWLFDGMWFTPQPRRTRR